MPLFFEKVQCFLKADSPIHGIGARACLADIFHRKIYFLTADVGTNDWT